MIEKVKIVVRNRGQRYKATDPVGFNSNRRLHECVNHQDFRARLMSVERGLIKLIGKRKCSRCGELKKLCEYHGSKNWCKSCSKEYGRFYKRTKGRTLESKYTNFLSRSKKAGHPCTSTFEEWNEAYGKESCECCGRKEVGKIFMHVDHCHETGKIRGTLCGPCNQAEGLAGGIEGLKKLISYLERHEEKQ